MNVVLYKLQCSMQILTVLSSWLLDCVYVQLKYKNCKIMIASYSVFHYTQIHLFRAK